MESSEQTQMNNDACEMDACDMSTSKGRLFKSDPRVNIITKEDFEDRISSVFHLLWKVLSKSFGPCGAPTLIYNYPFKHVTKDGYTIMKNLSFDATETLVDQAIADMAADICGRLNYTVGDGTTSAIIATNCIYKAYMSIRDKLNEAFILPRDIISFYETIKNEIIEELQKKAVQIRTTNMEELKKRIYDVVYVSSNGDLTITNYIADLYGELGAPAITCMLAPDGITKKQVISGYKYELSLNDKLYINSDDQTMKANDVDVLIFGTKVTERTYKNILKPLNLESMRRGRHLLVCAPLYDETALAQVIAPELTNEYKKNHRVNMILSTYRATSAHSRKLINDFAVLMNTEVIDRAHEESIITQIQSGIPIQTLFNIDNRNIDGILVAAINDKGEGVAYRSDEDITAIDDTFRPFHEYFKLDDTAIDVGFVKECSLGLQSSQFTKLIYDEDRYNAVLKDAELDLEEKINKYKKLGTFNVEVSLAQERLYALRLKMGIIEVGADTELSQKMNKDFVDDAVRAASSAFNHGVIKGCNLNLIQVIQELVDKTDDDLKKLLLTILLKGFKGVYDTVLYNAYGDIVITLEGKNNSDEDYDPGEAYIDVINKLYYRFGEETFEDAGVLRKTVENVVDSAREIYGNGHQIQIPVNDFLIEYSININKVYDVAKGKYTDDIINSLQTDEEILKATIDLIGILIVGNQMLVTQKHNF